MFSDFQLWPNSTTTPGTANILGEVQVEGGPRFKQQEPPSGLTAPTSWRVLLGPTAPGITSHTLCRAQQAPGNSCLLLGGRNSWEAVRPARSATQSCSALHDPMGCRLLCPSRNTGAGVLPFPPSEDPPDPGIGPELAGVFFTAEPLWKPGKLSPPCFSLQAKLRAAGLQ